MVRELYPRMGERHRAEGRGDSLAARLAPVIPKTYERTEFLIDVLGVTDVGAYYPHIVTYHPTRHGLRTHGRGDGELLAGNLADCRAIVHRCIDEELPEVVMRLLAERGARTVAVPPELPAYWTS